MGWGGRDRHVLFQGEKESEAILPKSTTNGPERVWNAHDLLYLVKQLCVPELRSNGRESKLTCPKYSGDKK